MEAAAVATRVIHHYDTRPGMSLGVVTFSETQAEAIEAAVRQARQHRPDLDRFFEEDSRLHGFFVKNLESVQGDERDVMIFSLGYGPDENGKLTMNFGPLNRQGGWRRLNVATTRAHYRNEIISSIQASDISDSVNAEGRRHLRRYLDYATRGTAALALDSSSGGDAESPFEESVISVIRSFGYDLTPQVGTAGYRVDIGVKHPGHPGAFALGVECDGYRYHSSRTARDRDRLREEVLRNLGWRLHRIWGTAWYRDRNGEEAKLRKAIEEAVAAPVKGLFSQVEASAAVAPLAVVTAAVTFDDEPVWTSPYKVTWLTGWPARWGEPGDPGMSAFMVEAIEQVVKTEGPVHISTLHDRLRTAWDIGRVGARIRENIDLAIVRSRMVRDGDFVTTPELHADLQAVTVRTPSEHCQRDIQQIHDKELAETIVGLARDARGIGHDDLTAGVARIFGWSRRGSDISGRLASLIAELVRKGRLVETGGTLSAGAPPSAAP